MFKRERLCSYIVSTSVLENSKEGSLILSKSSSILPRKLLTFPDYTSSRIITFGISICAMDPPSYVPVNLTTTSLLNSISLDSSLDSSVLIRRCSSDCYTKGAPVAAAAMILTGVRIFSRLGENKSTSSVPTSKLSSYAIKSLFAMTGASSEASGRQMSFSSPLSTSSSSSITP